MRTLRGLVLYPDVSAMGARAQRALNVDVVAWADPAVLNGARGGVLDENEEAVPFSCSDDGDVVGR